jgi:hypothetical protein
MRSVPSGVNGDGLIYNRIAGADSRHDVPDGNHQRPIPGRDRAHHTHGLAVHLDALGRRIFNHRHGQA